MTNPDTPALMGSTIVRRKEIHHDDAGIREVLPDLPGELHALVVLEPEVEKNHPRAGVPQKRFVITGLTGHDLDVR